MTIPTFTEEQRQWARGFRYVAGIDEAGRGPLAGPVVAAAVIIPNELQSDWLHLVADSKMLTAARREYLYKCLYEAALSIGIGITDAETIDRVGIAKATRLAMETAVKQLTPIPDYLLIDYFRLPEVKVPQKGITSGDSLCFSIASASIIAKVTRDHLMVEFDQIYPGYRFAAHKGYGTKEHFECLQRLGASPIHRRSFQPVKDICSGDNK